MNSLRHGWALAIAVCTATAGTAAEPEILKLPPFIVRGSHTGPKWYYSTMPGFEILSSTDATTTRHFAQQFFLQFMALRAVVPTELQWHTSVPTALILMDERDESYLSAQMLEQMNLAGAGRPHFHIPPQLRLGDQESIDLYFVLRDSDRFGTLTLGSGYLELLLSGRRPPLPRWFVTAITELYGDRYLHGDQIHLHRFEWLSPAKTEAVRRDPLQPVTLLPLAGVLSGPKPDRAGDSEVWVAESTLFLRWAIEHRDTGRLQAVWTMIEKAGGGPVSEQLFEECFGLDFTDMQERLLGYLPEAVRQPLKLELKDESRGLQLPEIVPLPATQAQYLRLWGNWERMEIEFVRREYPRLLINYTNQADDTFADAAQPGFNDPSALAVAGLYEANRRRYTQGRLFLQSAAAAGVDRPSVYTELARLLYEEGRAKAAGKMPPLDSSQAAAILSLLKESRRHNPPILQTYILSALTFSNSTLPISKEDWALLEEGEKLFPDSTELIQATADLAHRAPH